MFVAALDSCTLVPGTQRDVILSMADVGLLWPVWSERILGEVERALQKVRGKRGVPPEQIQRDFDYLRAELDKHFPDACRGGWEHLEGTFGLPDPNDEHVLALAIHAQAGVIVTDNLRDFPKERLPGELHALSPVEFIERTIEVSPFRAAGALTAMAERRSLSPPDLCDLVVMHCGMSAAIDLVRPYLPSVDEHDGAPTSGRA